MTVENNETFSLLLKEKNILEITKVASETVNLIKDTITKHWSNGIKSESLAGESVRLELAGKPWKAAKNEETIAAQMFIAIIETLSKNQYKLANPAAFHNPFADPAKANDAYHFQKLIFVKTKGSQSTSMAAIIFGSKCDIGCIGLDENVVKNLDEFLKWKEVNYEKPVQKNGRWRIRLEKDLWLMLGRYRHFACQATTKILSYLASEGWNVAASLILYEDMSINPILFFERNNSHLPSYPMTGDRAGLDFACLYVERRIHMYYEDFIFKVAFFPGDMPVRLKVIIEKYGLVVERLHVATNPTERQVYTFVLEKEICKKPQILEQMIKEMEELIALDGWVCVADIKNSPVPGSYAQRYYKLTTKTS